ncbi:phosphate transport system regulatory protein PhoU [Vandammella animalimorsus]|uniref:Phosphate-specific transport system accessory protein PhoU n=1 Tax=Vandammella animalimorsus TaxID=2029117 RepID=A0A2A2ALF7_9BURK|nr:phosphate signaling complex protein PhoU [Vandammella animalimorsus]PAT36598.1 phosphate transport system regulatory protein PhoU [Vandammella animalimorsus]PAT39400.1 phosphate transport system regulatory protein PhoU [Vandammella animalimorsus]
MPDQHSSSQFDAELKSISARIMEMGGLVESQIKYAIEALSHFDAHAVELIARLEDRVNALEVDIDADLSTIIATRQPTAKDLRMLLSISKATSNLERIGDESNKMGRMIKTLIDSSTPLNLPIMDLKYSGELAAAQLRRALDAFARHDVSNVVDILRQDDVIDREFEGYVRKLVTYMMEDPRKISLSMELLFLAKSIERIGDHSKNLAELIVFMVKGKDVRHTSVEQVQSALQ